ncbi:MULTISPECIES: 7-cyano-7-deazaguanine/7-aminomethyl-7-deazaguanine transporter [unclassified Moritella]|uniref:7-cyano-7-deazaguanine/7-aminomethyl-7- deazaguanine transporter n=1 Tax=unclassified Moritella TaxID=2637987 RepID=UPI001BA9ADB1|nr:MULTISPECIES: 7-cyano-7-deazaguanine/7-aminomethyl-7-deazaguanine transporter [unclassified Moritella]QUM82686.1 7-cyano-7-deazaguanine/7-aminomethyl-7-deazaguanine transporter [Moritella sp. 5]QUM86991.1 7-cyano-7-deazaguanine/7-aminomethyl-7-deazaguanine transporter [Moritella sp. 28]QUM91210.1 7-cyano-7-deazaguanine/7-aminomethyl-7-deazaguanine transporter [Moritella sp. 36]
MRELTAMQTRQALICLSCFHILVISASNYLVQLPINIFGFHTTWGAFTFPFIFLATDLTIRVFGAGMAKRIIAQVMLPALLISYVLSVVFFDGSYQGVAGLSEFNSFVGRIALASFSAYLFGQALDIVVFNRLRQLKTWWVAPVVSTVFGNLIDTVIFFFIAFYQSVDPFMAANWVEIATVDYGFKLLISLVIFLPLYGILLTKLAGVITFETNANNNLSSVKLN